MDAMKDLRGLIVILIILFLAWLLLGGNKNEVGGPFVEPAPPLGSGETYGPNRADIDTPTGWARTSFDHFSIALPAGWNSRVFDTRHLAAGEIRNQGLVLTFEYGPDVAAPITNNAPGHATEQVRIDNKQAVLIYPDDTTGITGIYFPNLSDNTKLSFTGFNLEPEEREIALQILRTISFSSGS